MILYITIEQLKLITNLSKDIDEKVIEPSMLLAQDAYITPFLGTALDVELKTALENQTNTTIQDELLSIIRKAQCHYTAYIAYVDILVRFTNRSVTTGNTENGNAVSLQDLNSIREISLGFADMYLKLADKFLCNNSSSFTNWCKKEIESLVVFDNCNNICRCGNKKYCTCYGI